MDNQQPFLEITNKDIYNRIEQLCEREEQDMAHIREELYKLRLQVQETNGKVKYNTKQIAMVWTVYGATTLTILSIFVWIFQNVLFR